MIITLVVCYIVCTRHWLWIPPRLRTKILDSPPLSISSRSVRAHESLARRGALELFSQMALCVDLPRLDDIQQMGDWLS